MTSTKMINSVVGKELPCAVAFLAICISMTSPYAQKPYGFISIDCGYDGPQYEDSAAHPAHLTWENDTNYIKMGLNGMIPVRQFESDPGLVPNKVGNRALQNFRYFEAGDKFCYELPMTTSNITTLIRATFVHGNAPQLELPIYFDVYIGATLLGSIQYDENDYLNGNWLNPNIIANYSWTDYLFAPRVLEGVFVAPRTTTYVCIIPNGSVPFISSLEMREFHSKGIMYNISNRERLLLKSLERFSFCGSTSSDVLRYPDDPYDRVWQIQRYYQADDCGPLGFNVSERANLTINSAVNNVPRRVMMTGNQITDELAAYWLAYDLEFADGSGYVYAGFYTGVGNESESGMSGSIAVGTEESKSVNVTNTVSIVPFEHALFGTSVFSVTVVGEVFISGMEVYEERIIDSSVTAPEDAGVIDFLKTTFDMTDMQGDPCTPVPFSWIQCIPWEDSVLSTFNINYAYISSITLSSLNNSSRLRNLGPPPQSSMRLTSMESISITNSKVDDATFQYILQDFAGFEGTIGSLDMSQNAISSLPTLNTTIYGFGYINLASNRLSGELPSPVGGQLLGETVYLTSLNLSYNSYTSLPKAWGNSTNELQFLDLSHNEIASNVSSLELMLLQIRMADFLQNLNISDNKFTGVLNASLYFSYLFNLQSLNFDQNQISGVLDLTIWHQNLKQYIANRSESNYTVEGLYSFVNNNISSITPTLDVLQPTIESLFNLSTSDFDYNQSGVLLGGNPFCKSVKRINSLSQQYLCRSSILDRVHVASGKKVKTTVFISVGTIGGTLFLLTGCVSFTIIWTLKKRLRTLQEFQQALEDRHVQPPIFSYQTLKLATNNFHECNKLGMGAFGAVYKGVLRDGAKDGTPVAVKRLFNSEKKQILNENEEKDQVLNEFLNEVVLITGIKHKNLVQLKGCCIRDKERILVYDYVENGNLAEALWGKNAEVKLDWVHRLNICFGIARGLCYLHEELQPRIIHRDIKPANILLDNSWNSKIADFGLAKPFLEEDTRAQFTFRAGTQGYAAPEYILKGQLTAKADVYSFGVLVLEIISGRRCIDSNVPSHQVYLKDMAQDLQKMGKLLDLLDPGLTTNVSEIESMKIINIALACVQEEPDHRPTMSQIVSMLQGNLEATSFLNDNRGRSAQNPLDIFIATHLYNEEEASNYSDLRYKASLTEELEDSASDENPFLGNKSFPMQVWNRVRANVNPDGTQVRLSALELSHIDEESDVFH